MSTTPRASGADADPGPGPSAGATSGPGARTRSGPGSGPRSGSRSHSRSGLNRTILALALPALATLAADPLVSLVDTAFVGRLGAEPLAALGVNTSLFAMVFMVFNFLAYGTTPMVGRALGRGDRDGAGAVVVQALVLAVVAGAVALAAVQVLAVPLLRAMGTADAILPQALTYLRIRALAGPALLLITAGNGAYRGFLDTRTPLAFTLLLNAVNLVLDPLFIFGFGWGLAGAAWATVMAQWVGALAFVSGLLRGQRAVTLPRRLPRPAEMLPFLRVGGDMLLRTGSVVGALTLATAVAARIGVREVAAHQIASQLWMFFALTIDALAVAGQALVATALGKEGGAAARRVANRLLTWGVALGVAQAALLLAIRPWLGALFTDDTEVLGLVAAVYPFVVAMQPLNALVFVFDGVFIGAERFRYLARAMFFSALVAAAVLLATLPLGWGLAGVWWGLTVLIVVRLGTLVVGYVGPRAVFPRR